MAGFDPSEYEGKVRSGFYKSGRKSRFAQLAANNLGITYQGPLNQKKLLFRDERLDLLDKYYEGRQYDHLEEWDAACCADDYVAIRKRKPRIIYNFAKVFCARVTSKLVGLLHYPTLSVSEDPDTTEFLKVLQNAAMLQPRLQRAIERLLASSSVFVRFQLVGGALKVEHYLSKYCYPQFDEAGELSQLEVRYVYEDPNDLDSNKNPKKKWFRMVLGTMRDVMFDNPEYAPGHMPAFEEVDSVDHGLGFVQGEWFRTSEEKHSPDGYSYIQDILDFIDELCYNLSQSSQAISYNQDPQTIINGMDQEEVETLIKSSSKAWNLGKDGKASLLESHMGGVKEASNFRDKMRVLIQDVARIVLLDPEKMTSSAQSGKAMEVLHGPMIELLNELRPMIQKGMKNLVTKMAITVLTVNEQGFEGPILIPDGYAPKSLDFVFDWPPTFPLTIEDLQKISAMVSTITSGNILSREWGTRYLSKFKEFGVEDPELELQRVASQPVVNPFGGF